MAISELPAKSIVNKVVPKNAFDSYTNTKQKKLMADLIERVRWTNKLSLETINLNGKEITEIQIFQIELRKKENISDLLEVIDKAIPYHIIFYLCYVEQRLISTSKKHPHPSDENIAVIDWTFATDWFPNSRDIYNFRLERSLDHLFFDFCWQLSGRYDTVKSISDLIASEKKFSQLSKDIQRLKSKIAICKQFNRKVELNNELIEKKDQLRMLSGG